MQTSIAIRVRRLSTLVCCCAAVGMFGAETRPKVRDVGATYAALFRKSPVGLKYQAELPAETARHLQTVAWETVQEYFRP